MLQGNIYNYNITQAISEKKRIKSKPITIKGKRLSYNPDIPNSPPANTPPNIHVIREIYLEYLTSFKK